MKKGTKATASSPIPPGTEDIDIDEYQLWLEEAELNDIVDIEDIPAFNEPFAKLIKQTIKCNDAFMELMRVEGHIFSYEKFVSTMGGTPTFMFSVFGAPLVEKHRMFFLNAWMFASYLRTQPMIDENGGFMMDLFNKIDWVEHFRIKRREKQGEFIRDFGMRKGYEANLKKQFEDDVSKSASPSSAKSTGQEPPETRTTYRSDASHASKETQSPIKENRTKDEDFDEEPPPPSSHDEDEDDDTDESDIGKSRADRFSVPSQVRPRKLYVSDEESDSDATSTKGISKKLRKIKPKKKSKKMASSKEHQKTLDNKSREKTKVSSSEKTQRASKHRSSTGMKLDNDEQETDDYKSPEEDNQKSDDKSTGSSEPPASSDYETDSDDSKAVFMRRIHSREGSGHIKKKATARITKRPVIPSDLKWDNRRASFPELKNRLQAHIIQAGMNYMIKPEFVRRFKKHGPQVLNYYKESLDISKSQLQNDLDVLYGYLKSAFRTGIAKKHIKQFETTCDGIRAYDAIDAEYGYGGDKNVLIQFYENIINQKYHRDFPEGITGFVDRLEDAFAELETLEEKYSNRKKFQFLTRNMLVVGLTDWMVGHCESNLSLDKESFRKSCQWLRSKDAQSMYASTHMATRKARMSRRNDESNEAMELIANYTNQQSQFRQRGPSNTGPMNVPYLLWKLLDSTTQKSIRDARSEQQSRGIGGETNTPEKSVSFGQDTQKDGPNIPRQYSNPVDRMTNKAEKETDKDGDTNEEEAHEENEIQDEDPEEQNDFDEFTRFMNNVKGMSLEQFYDTIEGRKSYMARTTQDGDAEESETDDELAISMHDGTTNVRAHVEFYDVIARLVKGSNVTVSTTDNGADTCVVGNGWSVFLATGRKANLVGFDSNFARKKGLPIVTADTVVLTEKKKEVIIRAHETVYNEGSPTTLISEFQVRSHGLVIDSVHKEHVASIDGRKGTQSFYLSEDAVIPLVMKGGLMTFENREPSTEDYERLDVIEITSSNRWRPRHFYDDSEAIPSLADEAIQGFHTKAPTMNDTFYETTQESDEFHWYSSGSFSAKVMKATINDDNLSYFDPSDDCSEKARLGRAFHLSIDYDSFPTAKDEKHQFIRDSSVNQILEELTMEEIFGYIPSATTFDTYAYAVRAVHRFRDDDLKDLQPHFAFRSIEVIKKTLACTTQMAKAVVNAPMTRHFASRFKWLSRFRLRETVCTDTIFANCQDVVGRTCGQVYYGTKSHMMNVYGMRAKSEMPLTYQDFMREEGIPSCLHSDGAAEQRSEKVKSLNREYVVKDSYSEPHHPWQNPAETRSISWLKKTSQLLMDRVGAPDYCWLYAMIYVALVNNWTADEILGWITPFEKRHGYTPDISALLCFHFFEKVFYLDCDEKFPSTKEKSGYILGIAMNVGDALTFEILTDNRETVICRSVVRSAKPRSPANQRVLFDPNLDPTVRKDAANQNLELPEAFMVADTPLPIVRKKKRRYRLNPKQWTKIAESAQLSAQVLAKSGGADGTASIPSLIANENTPAFRDEQVPEVPVVSDADSDGTPAFRDEQVPEVPVVSDADSDGSSSHSGENDESDWDSGEGEGEAERRKETTKLRRSSRNKKARANMSILVTALALMANGANIFENVAALDSMTPISTMTHAKSVDLEQDFGSTFLRETEMKKLRELQILDQLSGDEDDDIDWDIVEVIKHQTSRVARRIPKIYSENAMIRDKHVRLCVRFRNGETQWTQMDAVKLQDPFPIIQYAKRNKLEKVPSFAWIEKIVKDNDRLVQLARAYKAKVDNGPKYKFGTEVARNARHGIALDKANGNNLWKEATEIELKQINAYETFRLATKDDDLKEYQMIPYHMVYDVKFDGRRKARLVAGGNWTVTPKEDIYSGVIGMDSVRLAFSLASMHDLDVCAADIGNAFLYGKTKEKVTIKAGPEFGLHAGKTLIVDKGLYGLKSSAARFHEHLAAKLRKMGFKPSRTDLDLWYRKVGDYYEYIATYVDDILAFSKDPMKLIETIKEDYILKGVGVPEYYLGGNVEEVSDPKLLEKGVRTILSAKTYIHNVLGKLENMFDGGPFKKCSTPMMESYHPELDDTPMLNEINHSKYRAMIGSANWVITLGRMDVTYATNTMARYSMAPREGHLIALKRLFGYLRKHPDGQILIDPNPIDHSEALKKFTAYDNWREFYPEAIEEMPPGQPEPGIKKAQITIYVDADHAHDVVTRRSVTGIILFVNNTPVRWISKRQKTVETSTYGSELVAARIAVELAMEYRYSLRMLGVEVDGPCMLFGDNNSVILNTTIPSSMLKKKHNAIAYHRVRESVAAEVVRFVHVDSSSNLADVLTKPLGAVAFWRVVKPLLFRSTVWNGIDEMIPIVGVLENE